MTCRGTAWAAINSAGLVLVEDLVTNEYVRLVMLLCVTWRPQHGRSSRVAAWCR